MNNCPECDHAPVSFLRFFFHVGSPVFTCVHCGATLVGNRLMRRARFSILIIGALVGVPCGIRVGLSGWVGVYESIAAIIITTLFVFLPIEILSWKYGALTKKGI